MIVLYYEHHFKDYNFEIKKRELICFTEVDFSMISLLENVDGKIPNFAGIKYTHEDFTDFLSCLHFQNEKYGMLWGRDENILAAFALGF